MTRASNTTEQRYPLQRALGVVPVCGYEALSEFVANPERHPGQRWMAKAGWVPSSPLMTTRRLRMSWPEPLSSSSPTARLFVGDSPRQANGPFSTGCNRSKTASYHLPEMEKEFFTYTYSHEADKARIKNDNIMLPGALVERSRLVGVRRSTSQTTVLVPSGDSESNEWAQLEEADLSDEELVQVQAGVSHALAQSCKLGSFENSVDLLIERCGNVPLDLVRFGELHLGARDVMRMSGEVHLYRSYFNLQTDLLGTPDWFWENEQVEPLYERTARWLDTEKRGQLLNQRLEILKDLFMLFRDEVHVRTEHRLEWIIIILIVVEVVLQLFAMALGSRQSV
ncbi:hypothetical protein F1559_004885 [Cyanidiococcus yangmingshanensis]|uniref:DUF155 domain-containing protein n=1 Tax=Cyanidiococcus yangmingshanensis TaxID=2690220 RepID=A0A7J7IPE7_9RHOD|nr:hypothetical protein F1559_004885 [Cyanidiococcus yangmingshanensis]